MDMSDGEIESCSLVSKIIFKTITKITGFFLL